MNTNIRRRLAGACAAAAALLFAAAFAHTPARARTAPAPAADLNLRDFGALGDGSTDDGPALQRALDALAAAGGGTLHVPAGRYVIASPVIKDFGGLSAPVTIQGVGSSATVDHTQPGHNLTLSLNLVSEFFPRTREKSAAITLKGLDSLVVRDLGFIGTPNVVTDAVITLAFERVESAVVRHCEFYGLSTLIEGGAIIRAIRSGLHLEQLKFLGSVANSGVYAPVIENLEWKSVTLADVVFADYGQRPELFGKTNFGAPYSWVNIGNAAQPTGDSPRREVSIRRVFLDEGGYVGLSSVPYRYLPASAPIDLFYVSDLHMNVSNLATTGHYLDQLRNVLIEDSRYGWSKKTDSAIYLLGVGNAILSRIHTEAAATRLRAATGTRKLTVINSVYTDLASQAQVTRVIQGTDADDPVLHVRQRFADALGRDPDPAAHLYWSDQILRCAEGEAACVAARHAELDAYLAAAPPPAFDLTGRVTDTAGAAVVGAAVTLSGTTSARTHTDATGHYRFRNLPTSGVYTVSAGHAHFTGATPAQTFTTPDGDRVADFTGTPKRYAVSGRVVDNAGAALAGVAVSLAGSQGAAAATDAAGNYSFANLTGGGSVSVTPSLLGYKFAPAARNFAGLGANQTAVNFTGTPTAYTIAGRVTTDGAGQAGVTVTLSGARSATTLTNANGDFSFAGLPHGGDYTVTPSSGAALLAPLYRTYANLGANQTAAFTAAPFVNHARASNGTKAVASSYFDVGRAPLAAINGDRRGLHWTTGPSTGSGWADATPNAFPDWLEVQFPGTRAVHEVSVFGLQDNYTAPAAPTAAMTFTKYGLTDFTVEYWTGSAWAPVPGGAVTGNDKVWRRLTFAPLSTTKLRVFVGGGLGGHSRVVEVEAWGPAPPAAGTPPRVNHAAAANGADAAASSTHDAGRHPFAAINGDRRGLHWGTDPTTGSGWADSSPNSYPDYLEVTFSATRSITEVSVFGLQDNPGAPVEPTLTTVANTYALVDFRAQYWTGSAWADLPNGVITGNNKVWRRITFPAVTTRKVRVLVTKALSDYSRITEIEAY